LENYHVVINSIPAMVMCRLKIAHEFHSQRIYVYSGRMQKPAKDEILYDGTDSPCYRYSWLFGSYSAETTNDKVIDHLDWVAGVKPLRTTCNCHPRFHRIGRFGKWTRGVLSHTAFREAIEIGKREGLITDALF
jgi:hypothetical protein